MDVFSSLCRNQRERVRSREAADQTVKMNVEEEEADVL